MRFLPPLLVTLVFAAVVVRCSQEPHREEAQARIAGMVQGREIARGRVQLENYVARYTDEEDHWFASRMWFRLGDPLRAIDTIWKHPGIPALAGTAKRFAETALYTVGWESEDRSIPSAQEPRVLLALAEGGDTWAREQLRGYGVALDLAGVTRYFFPAYRWPTREPLEILVQAFRDRTDGGFIVGAALGALRHEDYPERAEDLARLKDVLASEDWRRRRRQVWLVGALALGRSEEEEAIAALRKTEARLAKSANARDQDDLQFVRIGLLAAGQWDVDEALAATVFGDQQDIARTIWYQEALIHRYLRGDMRTELRLRQVWEGPGSRSLGIRARTARAFLLREDLPGESENERFVGRMIRELEADGAPLLARAIASVWRLRVGEEGAREGLLEMLRTAARAFAAGDRDVEDVAEPFIEVLRALYLYG